jgi:putative two-component system response regulator
MHDIGKIGIPDSILLKTGPLTLHEQEIMREHTIIGSQLLAGSTSPVLQMAERIAASHHESWIGGGYPQGLSGEEIPFEGRIVKICDVYDALRSQRPYKPAYDHDAAMEVITTGDEGGEADHFDPTVLEAFLKLAARMEEIFEAYADYHGLPPVDQWLAGR